MPEEIDEYELEYYKSLLASVREGQKETADFEHAMMKPAYYLNGGAVVVYTTFLGAALNLPADPYEPIIVWSLGLLAAFLATYLGHESQQNFYAKGLASTLGHLYERANVQEEAEKRVVEAKELAELAGKQNEQWKLLLFVSVAMFVMGSFSAVGSLRL